MIHSKQIKEIANNIFHQKRKMQDRHLIHPVRDWVFGLLVALLIFALSAVWAMSLYQAHSNISVGSTADDSPGVVVYRESLVDAALEKLDAREQEYTSLLNGFLSVPKPEPFVLVEEPDLVATSTESQSTTTNSVAENVATTIIESEITTTTASTSDDMADLIEG